MTLNPSTTLRAAALVALAGGGAAAQGVLSPIGTILTEQSRTAFSVQGAGARAMGLGGAFIGVADDATAVTFNPAGLAQMVNPEMSFVGQGVNRRGAFQDAQTVSGRRTLLVDDSLVSNTRFDPLLLSGTLPLRVGGRTLAIQLSLQRLIPLREGNSRDMQERPEDGTAPVQLHQSINQAGQIDLYAFAAAYEVSQRILLGGSVNYWRGDWNLGSHSTSTTAGTTRFVHYTQDNHLEGANYTLGLLWRWETWSLGINRSTAFHGDYTYSASYASSATPLMSAPPYTTGLHWPATTGVGLAYRPTDRWLIALDVVRTPWSEARYMSGRENLNGLNFFDMSKGNRTPDATQFHLGVERILLASSGNVIPLRFGYSREPQPVTDRMTGQQRVMQGLSLGSGLKRGAYGFDLAYRYAWGRRRASQFLDADQLLTSVHNQSLGTEAITEHRLAFSFIVQFDRRPVQEFLHHLFVGG
ncbi:OmpP1/FadL family transporter [Mesoterricola silvestris]|uniref:Long-chain fatty acid transport protein n=1 Tax=Mesoterricola silvestris TaxID=2927979 RepID=A0AA48GLA2_9BACT|nr:hypothetical protein [Mesoterricola silvestris]BDU73467.1 hypothetical protein METEAL_26410 [Mesoterricola silvestris]